jgi:hypothetical protein
MWPQVMDELGMQAIEGAVSAPKTKVAPSSGVATGTGTAEDADVERLLASLRS